MVAIWVDAEKFLRALTVTPPLPFPHQPPFSPFLHSSLPSSLSLPFFCSNNSSIPQELGKDCLIEKLVAVYHQQNLFEQTFSHLPFRQYIIFLSFLPFARNSCAIGGSFVLNLDNTPSHCGLTQRLLCLVSKLHCNRQKLQPQCCLKELLKRKILEMNLSPRSQPAARSGNA